MDTWRNNTFLLVLLLMFAAAGRAQVANSCLDCHSALDAPYKVTEAQFSADIHTQKGFTCAACHGGDPAKSDDSAMSKAAGFRGHISRKDVPALCAHCHADGAYMRQHNPSLRTDQYSLYLTSVHGKRRAQGDDKVAVCTDCHSVHDIRPPNDPRSTVHPLNIAQTCARCHADAAYMKGYSIPTDQFSSYSASVHHDALAVRGDLSAPTCPTCHGNHGAAPPGVSTVQNVCSTCHVFQAKLFASSPHAAAFAAASLPGCVTCHSNHKISHPTDAMVGTSSQAVCTNCHTDGDAGYRAAGQIHEGLTKLDEAVAGSDQILDRAESDGMEISQARIDEEQAHDALLKARVTIHSFDASEVGKDIQGGMKDADKAHKAGVDALAERDYRRKGLGLSLIFIMAVVVGLGLYIRKLEGRSSD
jgi:predicted CXXCH cytochrome family protein